MFGYDEVGMLFKIKYLKLHINLASPLYLKS